MNPRRLITPLALAATAAALLAGCFNLKPSADPVRHFVLSPIPPSRTEAGAGASNRLALGIGPVVAPAYLQNECMAIRQGPGEISYADTCLWAEPLSKGIQRVLAENLSGLLGSSNLRLNAWRRQDVQLELGLSVEQFDVDHQGQGTLAVRWRISSPGGEQTLRSGQFRRARPGPRPAADPAGAVATLSALLADLSAELVRELPGSQR